MSALHTSAPRASLPVSDGASRDGARGRQPADLLVFSDDWGRHPSSCQHLVRALLPRHRVCWVNTIGTRPPRLDRLTARRAWGKLRRWTSRAGSPHTGSPHAATSGATPSASGGQGPNPRVLDPVMWPSFRSSLGRRLNRHLVARAVDRAIGRGDDWPATAGVSRVAVTTVPLVADLVGRLAVDRWVYYCVDDLSAWPGLDATSLRALERLLVERVDAIVAVSDFLVERMAGMGRRASLLTHGIDADHWRGTSATGAPAIAGLEPPLVVFWGVVDRRLDLEWLRALDGEMAHGTIVLVGPENNPDPRLGSLPRLVRTGALPYEQLPAVAAAASALVMPYADMPATRAIQPLKLKEYLICGKPVVSSRLPAVTEWMDACDVVDSAGSFADTTLARMSTGLPEGQAAARRRLENEGWAGKAALFETLVLENGAHR